MSTALAFGDALGPRGRRRVRIATVAGLVLLAVLVYLALARLQDKGQLDWDRWEQLLSVDAAQLLAGGLRSTLYAALTAGLLSFAAGTVLALGRLSNLAALRWVAGTYVEVFRALPSLLLILFGFLGLPKMGIEVSKYQALVMGLTLYNSAVFAEIVRAGILSLPRGQAEAGRAVGLTERQVQRYVVLPQALRRMLPSLVSQTVVVLKDTSYGFVIGYEELLRRGQIAGEVTGDLLQAYVIVAVVYIGVCFTLSRLARRLELRERRITGQTSGVTVAGVEDLAVRPSQLD